ncbi:MAG: hypothetical protein RL572_919 [Pseudomonadota bacterium]|jgi:hypothetical protein
MNSMNKAALTLAILVASAAWAQQDDHAGHAGGMMHRQGGMMMGGGMMGRGAAPAQLGQDAFSAIQQIVQQLQADPATDWSKVDIDALRAHLIDMNLVTLQAVVSSEDVEGGARHTVTGSGEVIGAIQRMVPAHAAQMSSDPAWHASTVPLENGVLLTVHATNPADVAKVRALGFLGFMVQGDHHLPHHLMLATGSDSAPAAAGDGDHQH